MPASPRLSALPRVIAVGAFIAAGAAATGAAVLLSRGIEARSRAAVEAGLAAATLPWAGVEVDGLRVILTGTAPDEVQRARAMSVAAGIVDPARVIDNLATEVAAEIPAPRFAVEILRSGPAISLIGLVPEESRAAVADSLREEASSLSDMLETAAHPAPEGWDRALRFGLAAVRALPRSKVSIAAGAVTVTGSADSLAQQRELEAQLARLAPAGLDLTIRLSAPRPVLTPFALRFRQEGAEGQLESCAADTEAALDRIRAAAGDAEAACTLGLGAPSPQWGEAAAAAIGAVRSLGAGEVTLTDADVTLAAGEGTTPEAFDRAAQTLKAALPAPFVLALMRPERVVEVAAGAAEFDATLEEGRARLRGRFLDARQQQTALAYAQSRFGAARVTLEAETSSAIPEGWGLRVLAGLEALSRLETGTVVIRPELVTVTGVSGRTAAQGEIARALAERLGREAPVRLAVRYDKRLDPQAGLPSPQECVATLNGILTGHKVTFAPGSATIEASAVKTLDAVAQAMRPCIDVRMEIGGHTDSQGRDEMNLQLSQARAEAVLEALLARRVPVGNLSARGYGETQPIAENRVEDGREANRRIEFKLILPRGAAAGPGAVANAGGDPGPSAASAKAEASPPAMALPQGDTPDGVAAEDQIDMPPLEEQPMDDVTEGEAPDALSGDDQAQDDDAATEADEAPAPEAPATVAPDAAAPAPADPADAGADPAAATSAGPPASLAPQPSRPRPDPGN